MMMSQLVKRVEALEEKPEHSLRKDVVVVSLWTPFQEDFKRIIVETITLHKDAMCKVTET